MPIGGGNAPSNTYGGRGRPPMRLNKFLARHQSSAASSMTSSASAITPNDPTLLGGLELPDETGTEKVHSFTVTDRIRAHLSRDLAGMRDRKMAALFVSHGESVEEAFPAWLRLAYLGGGSAYRPYDLNMPLTIPRRPHSHYEGDSPLTEHGKVTAELIGHGMRLEKLHPVRIYSSPDLRSVQTAVAIARSLRSSSATIVVEPALMEWTKLKDKDQKRHYFSPKQYRYLGYPIDFGYTPEASVKEIIERGETPREYHDRLTTFISSSLKATKESVVLFIGSAHLVHAARDEMWMTPADLLSISSSTDPCSIHMIEIGKGGEKDTIDSDGNAQKDARDDETNYESGETMLLHLTKLPGKEGIDRDSKRSKIKLTHPLVSDRTLSHRDPWMRATAQKERTRE